MGQKRLAVCRGILEPSNLCLINVNGHVWKWVLFPSKEKKWRRVEVINLPRTPPVFSSLDEYRYELRFIPTSIEEMTSRGRQKQAEIIDITIKDMILKIEKRLHKLKHFCFSSRSVNIFILQNNASDFYLKR